MIQEFIANHSAELIVGILAFLGAFLGTKRIKKQLIDNYIEKRVNKAQEVNDNVLSKAREIISSFEQSYGENKPVSSEELLSIVELCKDLSTSSADGGKEVSTVAYMLYETIKDLKPRYSYEGEGGGIEILPLSDIVGFVDSSLRLIIFYCTNSAPIPFETKLIKKSTTKKWLIKYLSDKNYYGLKHSPFGLTLNPNSEVILRHSSCLQYGNSPIFSRNFYQFLQSNMPIAYQILAGKIYAPLILRCNLEGLFFDTLEMQLIKIGRVKSMGDVSGVFVEFFYCNLSSSVNFVNGYNLNKFSKDFTKDCFTGKNFTFDENYKYQKKLNEIIKVSVPLDVAKKAYIENKWAIRYALLKQKRM